MAVTARDKTILWAKAAGRCSHPSCRKQLIKDGSSAGGDVLVGEVAHIVAQAPAGHEASRIRQAALAMAKQTSSYCAVSTTRPSINSRPSFRWPS